MAHNLGNRVPHLDWCNDEFSHVFALFHEEDILETKADDRLAKTLGWESPLADKWHHFLQTVRAR